MNLFRPICAILLLQSLSPAFGQPQPGTPRWSYDVGNTVSCSPALAADGTVYIGAGNNLYAITNAGAAASNKWLFAASGNLSAAPALAADGTIYIAGGYLYGVSPDGSQKWRFGAGAGNGSPAVAIDGTVYYHGAYALLYAVSTGGTLLWSNRIGGYTSLGTPSIGPDGTIYAPSGDAGALCAISPDGTLRWQFPGGGGPNSAAIGADGTIYVTGGYTLYAFTSEGTNLWNYTPTGYIGSDAVIGKDRTIYLAGWLSLYPLQQGYIVVLRAVSAGGALKWEFKTTASGQVYTPPAPAVDSAGTIYYCGFNTLYAVSPDGQQQWTFTGGGSAGDPAAYSYTSPLIGPDGTVYVTFGSRLYAVTGTNGPANSPWPMYRQNARHTGKVEKPVLKQPQKRSDANFEFQLYPQQLGLAYTVQSSSNLYNWTSVTSFVANTLPTEVVDLTASNAPARFYRAFSLP